MVFIPLSTAVLGCGGGSLGGAGGGQMSCHAMYVSLDREEPYLALESTSFPPGALHLDLEVELGGVWDQLPWRGQSVFCCGKENDTDTWQPAGQTTVETGNGPLKSVLHIFLGAGLGRPVSLLSGDLGHIPGSSLRRGELASMRATRDLTLQVMPLWVFPEDTPVACGWPVPGDLMTLSCLWMIVECGLKTVC